MNDKLVIYGKAGSFKVTPKSNYDACIMNARLVTDCRDFSSPEEIITYYCKWFGSSPDDFIIAP